MLHDRSFVRPLRVATIAAVLIFCRLVTSNLPSSAADLERALPPEFPKQLPARPMATVHTTSAAATIPFGRFTSIQVNVDAAGANILGDAANEPSIAVDPNQPNRMAIGWRQFDDVSAFFREAGYGYSTDGGLTWTTGKVEPGVFRSDPVLSFDAQGKFFYMSATLDLTTFEITTQLFSSIDGGKTWSAGVQSFGDDKEWMTVDRTNGIGRGHVYETWSAFHHPPTSFSRSIDGGQSFQTPTIVPQKPIWGTLDVASDGTLYAVGVSHEFAPDKFYVSRSTSAQDPKLPPTFVTHQVDLGGTVGFGDPNHNGLLGQPWIAVDPSTGPRSGWVYVLGSVQTPTDPLDIMFIRSTDGGKTWSAPLRVNDDPVGNHAFQWFGTMSVSPDGRIDAVWNDTRGSADSTKSALYYAYSTDGGVTWSANEQASPVWDCTLGWPTPNKIGDYCHMISHTNGADLAWSATFNGENDVYYTRIPAPPSAIALENAAQRRPAGNPLDAVASSTTIRFQMPGSGGPSKIEVFDAAGRHVTTLVDGYLKGGMQSVRWAGTDESGRAMRSGVYLARVQAAAIAQTVRLVLLR